MATTKIEERVIKYCAACGGQDVSRDATATWNKETQKWELAGVQDQGYCEDCGGEATISEAPINGVQKHFEPEADKTRTFYDESIADMALNMGSVRDGVLPDEDSRQRVAACISWAYQFEEKFKGYKWGEVPGPDYIEAIDAFFVEQFIATYGRHPFEEGQS
jgi:hypothetical protein